MNGARPRILLVNPNVDTCYEYVSCLGLMSLYLTAHQLGCGVELMDLSLYPERQSAGLLCKKEYDIVGISCNFTNAAPFCMGYAARIKEKYPRTTVIAGGNHATFAPDDLLSNGYDYVLAGEGEATFKAFIEAWTAGDDVRRLDGVVYRRDGSLVRNPARRLIADLDALPLNDYSRFDLRPYFERGGARYIIMETSRGCVYDCAMCSTVKMWGRVFRHKSPERIAEEFAIAKRARVDFVFMADDDTALDEENVQKFCRLLVRNNAAVPWGTTIGSRSIRDSETFRLMAAAGCVKVNICIESANERVLRMYRKPFTIEDNSRTCAALLKNGIIVHNHGIIGNAEETLLESLRTYWYLIRTSPIWHVSILEPRPGTQYWQKWDKKGDPRSYRLFGKANVILARRKALLYFIYRLFCLGYFLNPLRIYRAFFHPRKWIRFNYANQYRVALATIRENALFFLKRSA